MEFEAGRLDEEGNPPPFAFTMLYDVIRQLRATPELIFMAWSQSLDYNIGTAAHSMAAMTALCEHFNLQIGNWLKRPPVVNDSANGDHPVYAPESPSVGFPTRGAGVSDQEWANLQSAYLQAQQQREAAATLSECPSMMNIGGVSREQRLEMLKMFERQRRATSLYRHTCTLDGNTDIEMRNPVEVIDQVMRKHGNPVDMDPAEASTVDGDCLPVYPSAILASTVQTCTMYNLGSVVDWCSNGDLTPMYEIGIPSIGTRKFFNFSQKKSHGPCRYNTAWLRKDAKDGWMSFVKEVSHCNTTCKIFDLPQNALRDAFYLLTTRDNSRRCTEEPRVPHDMMSHRAFVDGTGMDVGSAENENQGGVRMRGMIDGRGSEHPPGTEAPKRHPYAKVPDIKLQRQIDYVANNGRLPAMMPMISNNVRDTPPVRLISEGDHRYIEINTAAAHEHTRMLAEASIRCSIQPGLENMQEVFCGDSHGPEGLCIDTQPDGSSGEINCTRMAYSYDLVSIALTLDAMGRYYDPNRQEYVKMYNDVFSHQLQTVFKTEDLPHMCLRFVGYEDSASRRFVSTPVNEERNKAFTPVEVGDDAQKEEDFATTHSHLQLSLGHEPSDDEVERYMRSRSGSRSMSGVRGDLMDMTTYIEHTLTTMKERGMLLDEDDVVMKLVQDDPYGLRSRVAEIAGREINKIVNNHQDIADANRSLPPDHDSLPEEKIQEYRKKQVAHTRMKLYERIQLPEHLDALRQYAVLDIPEVGQFTFQNLKKNDERTRNANEALKVRKRHVDASSQFKDKKRLREMSVPGKTGQNTTTIADPGPSGSGTALSRRGMIDGRSKAPMRF